MAHAPQIKIPATYMRGGTSKGVFFRLHDLPEAAQVPGTARDALLLRVIGSPDPYGKQIDGMGGATSSTSKTVIISKSTQAGSRRRLPVRPGLDRQGRSSTGAATAATCRRRSGRSRSPTAWSMPSACRSNGIAVVRIWQANIGKTIIAHVPITDGAGAGNRRLRARRRDLPGGRSAARIHGSRRRGRRRGWRDVPDRQPGR